MFLSKNTRSSGMLYLGLAQFWDKQTNSTEIAII